MNRREYQFWVYILSSRSRNLYVGMTNDLIRRVAQHLDRTWGSYTARSDITRLVYFEYTPYVLNAIRREKELKRWKREQKVELIEKKNPTWEDLYPGMLERLGFGKADSLRE